MKKVIINRAWENGLATMGMLTVVNAIHLPIFTLENPLRDTTVDSRIPYGEYFCEPYSGTKFKDVYIVLDVPGRSNILFHWGNVEDDTEGCILLGVGAGVIEDKPAVLNSQVAMKKFRHLIGRERFHLQVNPVLASCWASNS